jgi:DNA-binding transcriptional LysR family regulator
MPNLNWDDVRHAMAVGEAGSLAGAARALGVNHTTVLRRLDALETQLGARLFERQRSGYEPTEAGQALLEQGRHMAVRVEEIERQILGRDRALAGPLRLTTAFVVMDHLLPQPLAAFVKAYPGIEVEVVENAFLIDLNSSHSSVEQGVVRREADVALRLSNHVAEHLVGRQLGMTQCRIYAQRGAPGLPQSITPLSDLVRDAPWVAFERDTSVRAYDPWLRQLLAQSDVKVRVDIYNAKASMLRTGIGVGVLPTFMAEKHPDLIAVSEPIPEMQQPLWMVTHPDLRGTARVKAFMQFVGDALAQRLAEAPS